VVMPDWSFRQKQESAALAKEPSPLETLKDTFSNGAAAIGSQVNDLKDTTSSITQNLQQYAQTASSSDASGQDEATTSVDDPDAQGAVDASQ